MVMQGGESTVVAEYTPQPRKAEAYQSEADLENELITNLQEQGYEYLQIHSKTDLEENLRKQLEKLNDYQFSEEEWERFFNDCIANSNEGIEEKTRKIQSDHIQVLRQDNGATKNIRLIDKENIHNNSLQVINQYEENDGTHNTRYDVTILVNGLPLVHVELKRRGVAIREAFNQIKRYQRDSFWVTRSLYEYVQIFVISNGTHTKYYSNTTRASHVKELGEMARKKSKKTSNSFEFTSFWADGNNKIIPDLVDFTRTFFSKHTLLSILTKYCVFDADNKLLVMRPYQICATEKIINKIEISQNAKADSPMKPGTVGAGGFVWHTTGSGKTLTSFKAAQLASRLPYIDKVLFVVDRKDLDYQTIREYDRFEKGAADGNNSTRVLQHQLEDIDKNGNPHKYRIIVTTIQKLSTFISRNPQHEVYNKRVVIIFDECHRSQFGDMHTSISRAFKNYNLFGFTGTPIFAQNAGSGGNPQLRTTEQAFGDKLHTYTIVDAINDRNVLPFRIDYLSMMHSKDNIVDYDVSSIDRERAMMDPRRITEVTKYILEHFDQKTKRNSHYTLRGKRYAGFNSILATSSIQMAKLYYEEFKKQLAEMGRPLTIATIFSFAQNETDPEDDVFVDEDFDTSGLDVPSREFLESAIQDYNRQFNTQFDTSSDKFQNYYKDLSLRVKNREVDLLIVVNMFLTGFDATTLNTLWVDKDLKMHGLIQAFSRTNRILNSVKTYGNIVCFRNLQEKVDEAVGLFGDKDAGGIVMLKSYDEYLNGYEDDKGKHIDGYVELINRLNSEYPLEEEAIISEEKQKEFIKLFGKILRIRNVLTSFDQFADDDKNIISDRDLQDYQSRYIDLYQEKRGGDDGGEKEIINDDLVFEIELIRQIEVNIDYILMLVMKYHESNCEDKSIIATIDRAVDSSIELRSKKELIHAFVNNVTNSTTGEIHDNWQKFVNEQRQKELDGIIDTEGLNRDYTYHLIINSFRDGVLKTTGTDIDRVMPVMSRFAADNARATKKKTVVKRLKEFFEKYFGAI